LGNFEILCWRSKSQGGEERRGEERRGQERNIQHAIKRRKAADWLHFVYAVPSERPY